MKKLFLITSAILTLATSYAQSKQKIFNEILQMKSSGTKPLELKIVNFLSSEIHQGNNNLKGLEKGTIVSLSKADIGSLLINRNEFIQVNLPMVEEKDMVLTLKRNEIFTSEFKLHSSSDPLNPVTYTPGVHYKGIVDGNPGSVVALSVFKDQVMGLIATEQGNFMIGRLNNDRENRHIIYNDKDLKKPLEFKCGTLDEGPGYKKEQLENLSAGLEVNSKCVRLYLEVNNDIVSLKGGIVPATDYITGLYNQCFVLFANESISMMINQILAWATPSPYHSGTASDKLASFQASTSFFNGDLSQLLGNSSDGKAAGFNGLCNVNPDLSKCYSGIVPTYNPFPVYSQSVLFVCHELGHLLGSRHTHACVWNGNNTAIDGCAAPEGNCPQPPVPVAGTIMSYCLQVTGIDFNLGFGPQPGNVIRNSVNTSGSCLTACGVPTTYCLSYGLTSNNRYIKKVVLGSINNLTGNNGGYGNYISLSTNLTAGSSNTISLTPGSNGSTKYWRVWIDYNGDNDWDDAGELVGQKTGSQLVSISFTVPVSASLISTQMRVTMAYNAYASNCGSFPTGEVEDYSVVIIQSAQNAIFTTDLSDIKNESQYSVYPNPTSSQITIKNSNQKILGAISIYDISGKVIYKQLIENVQATIDVKSFSSGIYYLKSDQSPNTVKFVKQ